MPLDTASDRGRSAKFEEIGDLVTGTVVSAAEVQQTDLDTGAPMEWPDGRPRMQWLITLQTDVHEDDNDDGVRSLYARGGNFTAASGKGSSMQTAIRDAVKKAGKGTLIEEGATLAVKFTGLGTQKNRGFNPPKLYTAQYTAPAPKALSVEEDPF